LNCAGCPKLYVETDCIFWSRYENQYLEILLIAKITKRTRKIIYKSKPKAIG